MVGYASKNRLNLETRAPAKDQSEAIKRIKRAPAPGAEGPRAAWRTARLELSRDVGGFESFPGLDRRKTPYGGKRPFSRSAFLDLFHNSLGALDLGHDGSARPCSSRRYHSPNNNGRRRDAQVLGREEGEVIHRPARRDSGDLRRGGAAAPSVFRRSHRPVC